MAPPVACQFSVAAPPGVRQDSVQIAREISRLQRNQAGRENHDDELVKGGGDHEGELILGECVSP